MVIGLKLGFRVCFIPVFEANVLFDVVTGLGVCCTLALKICLRPVVVKGVVVGLKVCCKLVLEVCEWLGVNGFTVVLEICCARVLEV